MIGESLYKRCIAWFLLGFVLLGGMLVFWYSDIGDTLDNSVLLVESIVEGEFFDYYEYAATHSARQSQYSANYNVILYAIFAIWNFPTVIVHLATEVNYMNSTPSLLWCKLFIVAVYVALFYVIKKITEKFTDSPGDGLLAGFVSISSLCVFVPALVACQYDCLSLLFMLLGIYFYSERKTWQFLLMFAIAVPLKMFALFIFIPLILLRFKNVLKLAGMLIGIMLPSFLLELPFKSNPYFSVAMDSQNADAMDLLLQAGIEFNDTVVNLFIVALIIVCFLCYRKKESDTLRETYCGVYFSFVVFAAFCALIPIRSYWIILYTPFLAILTVSKRCNRNVAILADTIAGVGGGLYVLATHWIYNTGNICDYLILSGIDTPNDRERKYYHFKGFLKSIEMSDLVYAFYAIFIGALIFAVWYFRPEKNANEDEVTTQVNYWAILSRPIILLTVFSMLLFCNYSTQPAIKFGSYDCDGTSSFDFMANGSLSRKVQFESDETLSELTVYFKPEKVHRSARSFIGVKFVDVATDSVIWEDKVGIAVIGDDETVYFDLDGLEVQKNRQYRLVFSGINTHLSKSCSVYPYVDYDGEIALMIR